MMADEIIPLNAWKGRLASSKQGYKKSMTNLMMFIKNVRELGNTIRWNELAERAEWNGSPITDADFVDIRLILEANEYEPTVGDIIPAVMRHAKENSFHPVRDYLRGLKWDGTKRIDHWLRLCMGAQDNPFVRAVARKTLIAAVARAFKPGCKVDTVLVLEGPQGIRKSTAISTLFGESWTSESVDLFGQHNKMVMNMMGSWAIELAEFVAILGRGAGTVKGLISMRVDKTTLPYAKIASEHPRQSVFIATINPGESGYLEDGTGNRRYWPVEVTKADVALIAERRDQLWAEAFKAFQAGEEWWLSEEQDTLAQGEVADRERQDIWDEVLTDKLVNQGIVSTTSAAALQAIGVPTDRMDAKAKERVEGCLRRLGFKSKPRKVRGDDGKRHPIRIYLRENS